MAALEPPFPRPPALAVLGLGNAVTDGHVERVAASSGAQVKMTPMAVGVRWWRRPWHVDGFNGRVRPSPARRRRRTRCGSSTLVGCHPHLWLFATILLGCLVPSLSAAFVKFENCLGQAIIKSNPLQLQFEPLNVTARLDRTNPGHNFNVTVYGNVTGSSSPDSNGTSGQIVDVSESNNNYTTFVGKLQYLSYTAYQQPLTPFCSTLVQGNCPLGPVFDVNSSDLSNLPAFSVAHQLYSSYAFTTLTANLRVKSGDVSAAALACVSVHITPDLGRNLNSLLAFIPLAILVLVGFATAFAAIFSPWGSTDIFRWTTNYGRDADLLRLVTPGFGDALQYIQFVLLTGALSLSYPGYYQPVVSRVSWSALMFNSSFVTHGDGTQSVVDGIYVTNGSYGLHRMSQLVGMTSPRDMWAGMAIWLLVIIGAVVAVIQTGFVLRWGYRHLSHVQEEDLRAKNLPFTVGNVIRIVFNYLLLPIMALSMFQLVIAREPPHQPIITAPAAVLAFALIAFAIWLLRLLATIRPRSYLFDDLPTVLLYGSLYNTYSDDAAPFTMIPLFLQLLRGVAVGAVQPSGIAQLVLLAICEVIYLLTLHAFRPFHSPTSMNAYHTFLAAARLLTTLLSVAFVPSLGIAEGAKGWIGYVILILHAIVLVFCFLLNAIQTIVEVAARLTGAGGDGGAARGGLVKVFGMRQLSRRVPRRDGASRHSLGSEAAFLSSDRSQRHHMSRGRPRSTSGSSALLLNRHVPSDGRTSVGLETASGLAAVAGHNRSASGSAYTPTTPGAASPFSYVPGDVQEPAPADPYYRPPRARRPTAEGPIPGARSRLSWVSGDWANQRWSHASKDRNAPPEEMEGPSQSGRGTPAPAYGAPREPSDVNTNDPRRPRIDYAVREVDFYYRVRGPALSHMPTRRLGTGPADPTGPVASAASWLKGLFGGKTKEKGIGFEVIRSSRAPVSMAPRALPEAANDAEVDPYHDEVTQAREGTPPQAREAVPLVDIGPASDAAETPMEESGEDDDDAGSVHSESEAGDGDADADADADEDEDSGPRQTSNISPEPPSLPQIDAGGEIQLPSRFGSRASSRRHGEGGGRAPKVPRKSSKRQRVAQMGGAPQSSNRLAAIKASPPESVRSTSRPLHDPSVSGNSAQASRSPSPRMPFGSEQSSVEAGSRSSSMLQPPPLGGDGSNNNNNMLRPGLTRARSSEQRGHLRQTSLGFVQQHRASDSIHIASHPELGIVDLSGSSAEIVDDAAARSASTASRPANPS